jgi:hypothetical protein
VAQAQLVAAWQLYEQLKPALRITWGAEKFFGDGHWRTPDAWPRKEEAQKRPFDPCAHGAAVGRVERTRSAFRKAAIASAESGDGFDVATRDGDAMVGIQPGDIARWREKRARGEELPAHRAFALDRMTQKGSLDANDDTKTA